MTAVERPAKVLVVEDEAEIRRFVRLSLQAESMEVSEAENVARGLVEAGTRRPDLVVLDLGLPDGDGLDFIRGLRAWSHIPIIVLSARTMEADKIAALDAGADDYLVKPFELDELFARVRALLRRSSYAAAAAAGALQEDEALTFADLRMDLATREVTRGGRAVELTRTEFTLLEMFMAHPRQVLTREQILKAVWGFDFEPSSNSLDVYVMYLRRKTEAGGEPRLVHTVRGVGYVLRSGGAE